MPHKGGLPSAEKLLVLTLALEDALRRENFEEAHDLIAQRDHVISHLESSSEELNHARVHEAELRILTMLKARSADVVSLLRQSFKQRKALQAYHSASS